MDIISGEWANSDIKCINVDSVDLFLGGGDVEQDTGMVVLHVNIRSILKNWDELMVIIENNVNKIDMIILTEVNVKKNTLKKFEINNFERYENLREDKRGGGVMIFVNKDVSFFVLEENNKEMEMIVGKFKKGDWEGVIMAVYRPPDSKIDLFLDEIEKYFYRFGHGDVIFIGDVNLNINNENGRGIERYVNIMAEYGLCKCINGLTRIDILNGKLVSSCIDHIFVKVKSYSIYSAIIEVVIADHYMVGVKLIGGKYSEVVKEVMYIDDRIVEKELNRVDWDKMLIIDDVGVLYNVILQTFRGIYKKANKYRVIKNVYGRKNNKWMTRELLCDIKYRDFLFRRWKNAPKNITYRMEYKAYRNEINKKIIRTKNCFFRDRFKNNKMNMRQKWEEINVLLGRKKSLTIDEVIHKYMSDTHLEKVVEEFAEIFVEGVKKLKHDCIDNIAIYHKGIIREREEYNSFCFFYSDDETIETIIKGMNERKSPGFDGIRMKDIKFISSQISGVISKLINLSVKQGLIPDMLKTAIIRPVFKGGDHSSCLNYRPIAILPAIEKIMEKYIIECLMNYLEKNNLINDNQFGFQKGRSVDQLFTRFVDFVNNKLNDNKYVLVLFVDFAKAFDTIRHDILLKKLQSLGIRGIMLKWFSDYLKRYNLVKINDKMSKIYNIETGVPQGSILGPILYNIYVNDMCDVIKDTELMLYADDTALVVSHTNFERSESLLQRDFNNLLEWTHANGLSINKDKTRVMFIGSPRIRKRKNVNLIFHDYSCIHNSIRRDCLCGQKGYIENVNEYKYLGLTIDHHFKWDKHVNKVCKTLRGWLYHFNTLKFVLPYDVLLSVYYAMVESVIRFGLVAWGGASNCYIQRVGHLQDRILKQILGQNICVGEKGNDVKEKFKKCRVLHVKDLYDYMLILDNYNNDKFKMDVKHIKGTRFEESKKFILPRYNNNYGKNELRIRIPTIFNELPVLYRDLKGRGFKREIKNWFLNERI